MCEPGRSLMERIDELIEEWSMPELVAVLVAYSHAWKEQFQKDGNSEWQGWAVWEDELAKAYKACTGDDEMEFPAG